MKIATTIGEMYSFVRSPAEAVRAYEGTGFRYLDYSFYTVLRDPADPFMSDSWEKNIYDAKNEAEKLGFSFVQAHAPSCALRGEGMEKGLAATVRSIKACGILGIKNMVIHSGFFTEIKYPGDEEKYFRENKPFMRALIPEAKKAGVNILFENTTLKHCTEGCYFPVRGRDLSAFVKFMNDPVFGAAWDVGHSNIDRVNQYDEIIAMGKDLKAVHIHDNDSTCDMHALPMSGNTDYDGIIKGLIDSGYDGYFTLEADCFMRYDRGAGEGKPLSHPTLNMKRAALKMLYTVTAEMLKAYNVYEE